MKKMMVMTAAMTIVLSFGTAFAGDQAAAGNPYNGVTYFDLGRSSACAVASKTSQEKTIALYNGITAFGIGQESGEKGLCANLAANQILGSKSNNGITVF